MVSRRPELSLVLPAHNEAAIIEDTVTRVHRYLTDLDVSFELIVGDSGSTDDTGALVEAMGLDGVRVVRADQPGKGRILTHALTAAQGDVVGFLDADLEIPEEMVGALLQHVEDGADVAIAVKSSDLDGRAWTRRAATRGLNGLIRFLFRSHLVDHQAGCKLFRAEVLRPCLPTLRTEGWLWDTELLTSLLRSGLRIAQVPFEPAPSRPSRMSAIATLVSLRDLALIAMRALARGEPSRGPVHAPREQILSGRA